MIIRRFLISCPQFGYSLAFGWVRFRGTGVFGGEASDSRPCQNISGGSNNVTTQNRYFSTLSTWAHSLSCLVAS